MHHIKKIFKYLLELEKQKYCDPKFSKPLEPLVKFIKNRSTLDNNTQSISYESIIENSR